VNKWRATARRLCLAETNFRQLRGARRTMR
jgi:hypothetical protein